MQWKDISNFNFYVHPVNLKNHLGFFSFLNIFILLLVKIVFLLKPTSNKIISLFNIYKINNENFIKSRYDTSHIFESDRNSKFVYKIIECYGIFIDISKKIIIYGVQYFLPCLIHINVNIC